MQLQDRNEESSPALQKWVRRLSAFIDIDSNTNTNTNNTNLS